MRRKNYPRSKFIFVDEERELWNESYMFNVCSIYAMRMQSDMCMLQIRGSWLWMEWYACGSHWSLLRMYVCLKANLFHTKTQN